MMSQMVKSEAPPKAQREPAFSEAMAAELLLLVRLALTDKALGIREKRVLARIARDQLGVIGPDAEALLSDLDAYGGSVDVDRARIGFRNADAAHSIALGRLSCAIAADDCDLKARLARFHARIADILGVSEEALKTPPGS